MAQANGFSWRLITENTEEKLLDFSVNVNPLGIPGTVKKHIAGLADITGGYPDPDCRYLRSCLAEKYQVGMEQILCGNGADDLLYRLVLAVKPKRAIVIEPAFEEYGRALKLAGCEVAFQAPPFLMGLPVFLWNTGVSALVYFLCKETIGDIELKA